MQRNTLTMLNRRFTPVLAILLLLQSLVPLTLMAQNADSFPAAVKFMGSNEDEVLFQIEVDNARGEAFQLLIRDQEGNTLYNGRFTEKGFRKVYSFSKSELDLSSVTFMVARPGVKNRQSFQVSTSNKIVEDVVVTRL